MKDLLRALGDVARRSVTSPVPLNGGRGPNMAVAPPPGSEQYMRAYGAVGTLHAIVSRLANATSQVRWHLYESTDDPDAERDEVKSHLAISVWNRPNKYYTRQAFVETFMQHLELTGESEWILARAGTNQTGPPLELWPVRPDRISPVPSPTDFLAGWAYNAGTEIVPLRTDQVIQLKTPNPLDPYRGLGPVQSILIDLESSDYAAKWNRNFFQNSAQPGGIVEVPGELSDKQFRQMRDRWEEQHKGVANAHRVAILETGKWVDRKYTMADMQFAELRMLSSEVIRQAFTFPKPMLGTVEDVNRANAEAAMVVFAEWLLVPRLERIREALNTQFLPLFGPSAAGLEFDYDSPVPSDDQYDASVMLLKANAALALTKAGYDLMDILDTVGLPKMKINPVPPRPDEKINVEATVDGEDAAVPGQDAPLPEDGSPPVPPKGGKKAPATAAELEAARLIQSVFNEASQARRRDEALRREWMGV